jgi:hypothetical protein
VRVDPESERVVKRLRLDVPFVVPYAYGAKGSALHRFVAVGEGAVWVAAGRRWR